MSDREFDISHQFSPGAVRPQVENLLNGNKLRKNIIEIIQKYVIKYTNIYILTDVLTYTYYHIIKNAILSKSNWRRTE